MNFETKPKAKAEVEEKAPAKLRGYFFPHIGLTIEAESLEEAEKKAQALS